MIDDHGCGGRMAGFFNVLMMMMNDYDNDYEGDNENVI